MAFDEKETRLHRPVLSGESIGYLMPDRGGYYLDCTMGGGGHSEAISNELGGGGWLFAIDLDPDLVRQGHETIGRQRNVTVKKMNYRDADLLMEENDINGFDGIILDLGFSSFHIDRANRGFSFKEECRIDMRYDPGRGGITGWDVINSYSKEDIRNIVSRFGEERDAARIAAAIVTEREKGPIDTPLSLWKIIGRVKGGRKQWRIDPATKTFQALRIFVNGEMENLETFMRKSPSLLSPGGRLVVISYHSLEDRMVKNYLRKYRGECICPPGLPLCGCGREKILEILTPRPVRPKEEEVRANRRARSARLRAAMKVGGN